MNTTIRRAKLCWLVMERILKQTFYKLSTRHEKIRTREIYATNILNRKYFGKI